MRLGGRLQAAIEVLDDVLLKRTPVNMALRDWGKANRYAGSKDRSAVGNFVHDALRQKSSIAFRMDSESSRALIFGAACFMSGQTPMTLARDMEGDKYSPGIPTPEEIKKLEGAISLDNAPDWVKADVPEWLWPAFENNFGEHAVSEGQALTHRPPLDLRVNTLKSDLNSVFESVKDHGAMPAPISPVGIRIPPIKGQGRHPNLQIEPGFQMGEFEIQDEGSQIVSLLVNAQPGETVLDYCAGGGGKSLALAAEMQDQGAIHAFDIDKRRLAPLYQRAQRAGASMVNICQPPDTSLSELRGKMDRVLIDSPCTGVGTWRRKPDAKWRLTEDSLTKRMNEQKKVLTRAKDYVRPGGYLIYVTCSMLGEENEGPVYTFLDDNEDFTLLSAGEVWEDRLGVSAPKPWSEDGCTLTLTPAATQTDGFFFAVMEKTQ